MLNLDKTKLKILSFSIASVCFAGIVGTQAFFAYNKARNHTPAQSQTQNQEQIEKALLKNNSKNLKKSYAEVPNKVKTNPSTKKPDPSNEVYPEITADMVISLGPNCRPAHHLSNSGLRLQSAPLDYMMGYSLKTALHLYETKFEDYFESVSPSPNASDKKLLRVTDTKNNVISVHHFKKDAPFESEKSRIRDLMKSRAEKIDSGFNNAQSIVFVGCWPKASTNEFKTFLQGIKNKYSGKSLTIVNIKDDRSASSDHASRSVLCDEKDMKVIQYTFNDKGDWKGNTELWSKVLKSIKLNK